MRHLLHTLYITEQDIDLKLRDENVVLMKNNEIITNIPLICVESIVSMSYRPTSPALLEECAKKRISFFALNKQGKLKYRVTGGTYGNPELRIKQYEKFLNNDFAVSIAKEIISSKIYNSCCIVEKQAKNHPNLSNSLHLSTKLLKSHIDQVKLSNSIDNIRNIEGIAARTYFKAFGEIINSNDELMAFDGRNKRPPMDPLNSLLSLTYTLLSEMCISALETTGLDPFIGVIHTRKSGKPSFALDMVEELRAPIADRFVLRLCNLNILSSSDFSNNESGCNLSVQAKKVFFNEWEKYKIQEIYVQNEKIPIGLLPFLQAQKMARFIYEKDKYYTSYRTKKI